MDVTYLKNLTNDIINNNGLCKLLFMRNELIHIKHCLKRFFIKDSHAKFIKKEQMGFILKNLNLDYLDYIEYLAHTLRNILKYNRDIDLGNDAIKLISKLKFKTYRDFYIFKVLNPIVIFDFDGVLTNKNFIKFAKQLVELYGAQNIKILTANRGLLNNIKDLTFNRLGVILKNDNIHVCSGKKAKIRQIKNIATMNKNKRPIIYFDNEECYLEYGCFMFMHTFIVNKNGKFKKHNCFN